MHAGFTPDVHPDKTMITDYFSEITLSYRSPLTAPPRIEVFTLYTNCSRLRFNSSAASVRICCE